MISPGRAGFRPFVWEGGMRRHRLLSIFGIAAAAYMTHGSANAGPIHSDDPSRGLIVVAAPAETMKADSGRAFREPTDADERTRLVSYLILRGLQGAGGFLAAR